MPRRARRESESEYFHIIVQGIDRKYIFNEKKYIEKYRDILNSKTVKYNIVILAYCIMNNHAHILVYSDNIINMGKYMKAVNTEYARYYNLFEKRVGYVFRDRYLSEPIKNEMQLYNCISYIHFNPVEANIVSEPNLYNYSSYNEYINRNGIINDKVLKLVFASDDYIEMFKFIHYGTSECMDLKNDKIVDISELNIQCVDIKCNEDFKEECFKLKKLNISNRMIAKILGVGRNKINEIIKQCQ